MIELRNLCFSYGTREVLKNVSFCAHNGEVLSVLGPNAVGKSTLFGCILGLSAPKSGEILIDGAPIAKLSTKELAQRVAFIPQSHNPVFNYTVLDMALMGASAHLGTFSNPTGVHRDTAERALARLGILHLKDRGYLQISGGERQLTLIARALVQNAKILLMDEPSSSLDFGNRLRVMQTLRDLAADGYCIVQSTHDPEQAYLYSDRILALCNGQVLAHGAPKDVFNAQLISKLYGVEVEVCEIKNDAARVCIPKGVFR